MQQFTFDAVIKRAQIGKSGGSYVEFPFDVMESFGVKGRIPVQATFDGFPYQGSLVRMGTECHILGMPKAIKENLGKQDGDTVRVTIEPDKSERTVEIPPALKELLTSDSSLGAAFEKLSYTKQKEMAEQISSAKKAETLAARLVKIRQSLKG